MTAKEVPAPAWTPAKGDKVSWMARAGYAGGNTVIDFRRGIIERITRGGASAVIVREDGRKATVRLGELARDNN